MRTISSDQTFGAKFIVPALVVLIFDAAALGLWWDPTGWPMSLVHASADPMRWVFASVAVLLTGGSLWFGTRLKAVKLDDDALYVSNFRREARVPLGDIERLRSRAGRRARSWPSPSERTRPLAVRSCSCPSYGS